MVLFRIPLLCLSIGTVVLFLFGYAFIADGIHSRSYGTILGGALIFLLSLYVGFISIRWFWRYLKAIFT